MNKNQKRGILIVIILTIGIFSYFSFTDDSTVEIESIEGGSEKILAGNSSKYIGFRVNYKDSATDKDEENIAEEFGIPYQHTKVIVHNGKKVLKSLEQWNKERYLEELNKFS